MHTGVRFYPRTQPFRRKHRSLYRFLVPRRVSTWRMHCGGRAPARRTVFCMQRAPYPRRISPRETTSRKQRSGITLLRCPTCLRGVTVVCRCMRGVALLSSIARPIAYNTTSPPRTFAMSSPPARAGVAETEVRISDSTRALAIRGLSIGHFLSGSSRLSDLRRRGVRRSISGG